MNWKEVRDKYPKRWVLVEALEHKKQGEWRIIIEMSVINDYESGAIALKEYAIRHKKEKNKEMYVYHTKHEELKIKERFNFGVHRIARLKDKVGMKKWNNEDATKHDDDATKKENNATKHDDDATKKENNATKCDERCD